MGIFCLFWIIPRFFFLTFLKDDDKKIICKNSQIKTVFLKGLLIIRPFGPWRFQKKGNFQPDIFVVRLLKLKEKTSTIISVTKNLSAGVQADTVQSVAENYPREHGWNIFGHQRLAQCHQKSICPQTLKMRWFLTAMNSHPGKIRINMFFV